MVVAINSDAEVIAPLSADRAAQARAVDRLDPWSTTALHDAVIATLDRLEPEEGRQALVVFSDGTDRYSRATVSEVLERARRSNALIYPIAFGKQRPPLLAEFAAATGGRSFPVEGRAGTRCDAGDRSRANCASSTCLATPRRTRWRGARTNGGPSGWRSEIAPAGVRIRARDGYTTD